MIQIGLLIICLACGVLCHHIAGNKGRRSVFWGVMGVLFGPFAVPFVLVLKKPEDR